MLNRIVLLLFLNLLLCGCGSVPAHLRPDRVIPSDIHEKAIHFQQLLDSGFMTDEGLICIIKPADSKGPVYANVDRQAELTALALLAEVHRYEASGNMDAIYNIDKLLSGIELCFAMTSLPGYPASAVAPSNMTDSAWRWNSGDVDLPDQRRETGFHWRGDTPRATCSAIALALMTCATSLERFPNIRQRARAPLVLMADHIHQNSQSIVGVHGQITRNGDLYAHVSVVPGVIEFPIGVNALNAMAFQVAAFEVSGKARFKARMLEMVHNDILDFFYPHRFNPWPWADDRIEPAAFTAMSLMLRSKSLPIDIRKSVIKAARTSWKELRDYRNIYTAALIAPALDRLGFPDGVDRILQSFPNSRVYRELDLSGLIEHSHAESSHSSGNIPLYYRGSSPFLWHDDPRAENRHIGALGTHVTAPVDYLCAYWMARSLNWIETPTESKANAQQ